MTVNSRQGLSLLGPVTLFCGVETASWTTSDFVQAAQFASASGVDTLIIKVCDGAPDAKNPLWYGGLANFQAIVANILTRGIKRVVPLIYCYGNVYNAINDEIATIAQYLAACGTICLDMETEWNDQPGWAGTYANALKGQSGAIYVSCLADPATQNQGETLQALAPCVSAWMPQIYTDYLQSVWKQQFQSLGLDIGCCPTYDLASDFGNNNVLASVQANQSFAPQISLWEYGLAKGAQNNLMMSIVESIRPSTIGGMSLILSKTQEVVDLNEADQFPIGKSQFECGFFAVAMAKSMVAVGQTPTLTATQIMANAESWYAQYDGTDNISNTAGMSTEQEYELLQQVGLHYQAIALNMSMVIGWLKAGYPVLLAVVESSVKDLGLGINPYPWTPAGNHMILATGVTVNGNLLVRDSANCTSLTDPNSLRPGPRTYNASTLQLVSATVVVPPGLPRPTSATPPIPAPVSAPVPRLPGWTDDGTTLTALNGHKVVLGFRSLVRSLASKGAWNAANQPLEEEYEASPVLLHNASVGAGQRQCFRDCLLWYTPAKGVVLEPQNGSEMQACYVLIASQQAEIAALKATSVTTPIAAKEVSNG